MYGCTGGGNYILKTPNGVIPVIIVITAHIGIKENRLLLRLLFGIYFCNTVINVQVFTRRKNENKTLEAEIQIFHN